ncbi:MAG: hypothetical protein HY836_11010 [Aquabacterium sp.]|uniref:hypothetical protein n=1 Tax=Aquabacterium sp. TaxID=1872578 RepID=UPI0025C4D415|nr:hypothetical protein [Aquabacterium sp.]MBI5926117.1 hypothetical protein [Aquabacterium sp.]
MLPVAVLTACGGGGAGSDPSATPSQVDNYVSVDGGNSSVPAGRYALDTSYKGVSRLFVFDVDTIEAVAAESSALDMSLVYSPSHPEKFAIIFGADESVITAAFVCRSSAWTTVEVQEFEATIKAPVPLCPKNILINTATRHVAFTGLMLTSADQSGKTVTISADFSWLPPDEAFMSPVTVEPGSTAVSSGSYGVIGRSVGSTLSDGLELGYSALRTHQPEVRLYVPRAQDGRFALSVSATTNLDSVRETYACISAGWNTVDKQRVESSLNSPLDICPSTVSYDSATRLLTLNKAPLMGLNNSGRQLLVSLKANMPEPRFSAAATPTNPSPGVAVAPAPAPITPPAPASGS